MKPLRAIIIAILCIVGGLYWYAGQQEQHYDAAARNYLQRALVDIGSWRRESLQKHLAPQALQAIDAPQLDALTERYRPLGAFVRCDDLRFERLAAALSLFGSSILLNYHGTAQFAHGSATLTVTLIVIAGEFRLYNFSLGSPQIK